MQARVSLSLALLVCLLCASSLASASTPQAAEFQTAELVDGLSQRERVTASKLTVQADYSPEQKNQNEIRPEIVHHASAVHPFTVKHLDDSDAAPSLLQVSEAMQLSTEQCNDNGPSSFTASQACCNGLRCPYAGGVCCSTGQACCPQGSVCLPPVAGQPQQCAQHQGAITPQIQQAPDAMTPQTISSTLGVPIGCVVGADGKCKDTRVSAEVVRKESCGGKAACNPNDVVQMVEPEVRDSKDINGMSPAPTVAQAPAASSGSAPAPVNDVQMDKSWVLIAKSSGRRNMVSWKKGFGTPRSSDYIADCKQYDKLGVGANITVRLTMGQVVDYFRPTDRKSLCDMLLSSYSHLWAPTQFGPWYTPEYMSNDYFVGGGSSDFWLRKVTNGSDPRKYISFWGSSQEYGGCCTRAFAVPTAWKQPYVMHLYIKGPIEPLPVATGAANASAAAAQQQLPSAFNITATLEQMKKLNESQKEMEVQAAKMRERAQEAVVQVNNQINMVKNQLVSLQTLQSDAEKTKNIAYVTQVKAEVAELRNQMMQMKLDQLRLERDAADKARQEAVLKEQERQKEQKAKQDLASQQEAAAEAKIKADSAAAAEKERQDKAVRDRLVENEQRALERAANAGEQAEKATAQAKAVAEAKAKLEVETAKKIAEEKAAAEKSVADKVAMAKEQGEKDKKYALDKEKKDSSAREKALQDKLEKQEQERKKEDEELKKQQNKRIEDERKRAAEVTKQAQESATKASAAVLEAQRAVGQALTHKAQSQLDAQVDSIQQKVAKLRIKVAEAHDKVKQIIAQEAGTKKTSKDSGELKRAQNAVVSAQKEEATLAAELKTLESDAAAVVQSETNKIVAAANNAQAAKERRVIKEEGKKREQMIKIAFEQAQKARAASQVATQARLQAAKAAAEVKNTGASEEAAKQTADTDPAAAAKAEEAVKQAQAAYAKAQEEAVKASHEAEALGQLAAEKQMDTVSEAQTKAQEKKNRDQEAAEKAKERQMQLAAAALTAKSTAEKEASALAQSALDDAKRVEAAAKATASVDKTAQEASVKAEQSMKDTEARYKAAEASALKAKRAADAAAKKAADQALESARKAANRARELAKKQSTRKMEQDRKSEAKAKAAKKAMERRRAEKLALARALKAKRDAYLAKVQEAKKKAADKLAEEKKKDADKLAFQLQAAAEKAAADKRIADLALAAANEQRDKLAAAKAKADRDPAAQPAADEAGAKAAQLTEQSAKATAAAAAQKAEAQKLKTASVAAAKAQEKANSDEAAAKFAKSAADAKLAREKRLALQAKQAAEFAAKSLKNEAEAKKTRKAQELQHKKKEASTKAKARAAEFNTKAEARRKEYLKNKAKEAQAKDLAKGLELKAKKNTKDKIAEQAAKNAKREADNKAKQVKEQGAKAAALKKKVSEAKSKKDAALEQAAKLAKRIKVEQTKKKEEQAKRLKLPKAPKKKKSSAGDDDASVASFATGKLDVETKYQPFDATVYQTAEYARVGKICLLSGVSKLKDQNSEIDAVYSKVPYVCRPNATESFGVYVAGRFDVQPDGNVRFMGGNSRPAYWPLDSMFYPSADAKTRALRLKKPWTAKGQGYGRPSFFRQRSYHSVNPSQVCWGPQDNSQGTFEVNGYGRRVKGFMLEWTSGASTCAKKGTPGRWGCNTNLMTFITTQKKGGENAIVFPKGDEDGVSILPDNRAVYTLKNFNVNSTSLKFKLRTAFKTAKTGPTKFNVFHGSDLFKKSNSDHQGTVCAKVHVLYAEDLCILSGTVALPSVQVWNKTNAVIGVLPKSCRPKDGRLVFSALSDTKVHRVDVRKDGRIVWVNGIKESAWVSLAGIAFFTRSDKRPLSLKNGFEPFKGSYRLPSFKRQGKLCLLSGRIRGGPTDASVVSVQLPASCRPTKRLVFATNAGTVSRRFDIYPDGTVWTQGGEGWKSLDGIHFVVDDKAVAANIAAAEKAAEENVKMQGSKAVAAAQAAVAKATVQAKAVADTKLEEDNKRKQAAAKAREEEEKRRAKEKAAADAKALKDKEAEEAEKRQIAEKRVQEQNKKRKDKQDEEDQKRREAIEKANQQVPTPGKLVLQNGFIGYDSPYTIPRFVRLGSICVVSGMANSPNLKAAITELPADCRPSAQHIFRLGVQGLKSMATTVSSAGIVQYKAGPDSADWVSLDGMVIPGKGSSLAGVPLKAGWRNFQNGFVEASYTVSGDLCVLSGVLSVPTGQKFNNEIAQLPEECRPFDGSLLFSVSSGDMSQLHLEQEIEITWDGKVYWKSPGDNRLKFVSLSGVYFFMGNKTAMVPPIRPRIASRPVAGGYNDGNTIHMAKRMRFRAVDPASDDAEEAQFNEEMDKEDVSSLNKPQDPKSAALQSKIDMIKNKLQSELNEDSEDDEDEQAFVETGLTDNAEMSRRRRWHRWRPHPRVHHWVRPQHFGHRLVGAVRRLFRHGRRHRRHHGGHPVSGQVRSLPWRQPQPGPAPAPPGVHERNICEGHNQQLSCPGGGVISIVSAKYGRRSQHVCPHPAWWVTRNTGCNVAVTGHVANSCNNKPSCNINANNGWFGDPCPGTYKYLRVRWTCSAPLGQPAPPPPPAGLRVAQICEGYTRKLKCKRRRKLVIHSAVYGRTSRAVCPHPASSNLNCRADWGSMVQNSCQGRRKCFLTANNRFGDPCGGTYKYLSVTYQCVKRRAAWYTPNTPWKRPALPVTVDRPHTFKPTRPVERQPQSKPWDQVFQDLPVPAPLQPKTAVVCSTKKARLNCAPGQVLRIQYASVGRASRDVCPNIRDYRRNIRTCRADYSPQYMGRCDFKSSCIVSPLRTGRRFCRRTDKYLTIGYSCVPGKVRGTKAVKVKKPKVKATPTLSKAKRSANVRTPLRLRKGFVRNALVYRTPSFHRQGAICALSGVIFRKNLAKQLIGKLPAYCRPVSGRLSFTVDHYDSPTARVPGDANIARIDVYRSGKVVLVAPSIRKATISLDGVLFAIDETFAQAIAREKNSQLNRALRVSQFPISRFAKLIRPTRSYGEPFPLAHSSRVGKVCYLSGRVSLSGSNRQVARLHQNCIPRKQLAFTIIQKGRKAARVDITPAGVITWVSGARGSSLSLDGLVFPAKFGGKRTPIRLRNGWQPYGGALEEPHFVIQGNLCVLSGSVRHPTWNNVIGRLPNICRPRDGRLIFNVNHGSGVARVDVTAGGELVIGKLKKRASYISLDGISFVIGANFASLEKTLLNGYAAFGRSYRIPGYLKQGKVCTLTGMVTGQGAPSVLVLPEDCRPSAGRLAFTVNVDDRAQRIDVLQNGEVRWISGPSKKPSWIPLDGVRFVVDAKYALRQADRRQRKLEKVAALRPTSGSLAPINGYTVYGDGAGLPSFSRVGKICFLSGLLSSPGTGAAPFLLPQECRPAQRSVFTVLVENNKVARFDVNPTGSVQWVEGQKGRIFPLDSIHFPVAQARIIPLRLRKPWANFGSGYPNAGYLRQGEICSLSGLVTVNNYATIASRPVIARLPYECRPRSSRRVFNVNHGTNSLRIDVFRNGVVRYISGRLYTRWLSLNGITFTIGTATAPIPLQSTWKTYSTKVYGTPFYKRQGVFCSLSGTIRGQGVTIGQLPDECRPSGTLTFGVNHNDRTQRVDVNSQGIISWRDGVSGDWWLSLEGIRFVMHPEFAKQAQAARKEQHLAVVRAQPLSSALNFINGNKEYGTPFDAPHVSVLGDLCIFSGVVYTPNMRNQLANIAEKCRPAGQLIFNRIVARTQTNRIDIATSGTIGYTAGGIGSWLPLNGITYFGAGAKAQPVPLSSGWTNYGYGYLGAFYIRMGEVCVLTGLVRNTNGWRNKVIAVVPNECRPKDGRLIFSLNHHQVQHRIDITAQGEVVWVSGSIQHDWVSLSGIVFTASVAQNSQALSLKPEFGPYGHGYRAPTVTRQGTLCVLGGLLQSRQAGASKIAELPSECRPSGRLIFGVNHDMRAERIDILADGTILWAAGSLNGWLPLDGIHWVVDSAYTTQQITARVEKERRILSAPASTEKLNLLAKYYPFAKPYAPPMATRLGGLCFLTGLASTLNVASTITMLPPNCRPSSTVVVNGLVNKRRSVRVEVSADGVAQWRGGASKAKWLSFDNFHFPAASAERSQLSLSNGWVASPNQERPAYITHGRYCQLTGVAVFQTGTRHWNQIIGTLPNECVPRDGRLIFNVKSGNQDVRLDILADGRMILITHSATNWVSLSGIGFFAASGGTSLALRSGYAAYLNSYRVPSFRAQGPLCSLTGLVRVFHGHGPRLIAVLPEQCRPLFGRLVFAVNYGSQQIRVDITKGGKVLYIPRRHTGENAWISLDGISFIADGSAAANYAAEQTAAAEKERKAIQEADGRKLDIERLAVKWGNTVANQGLYSPPTYTRSGPICIVSGTINSTDLRNAVTTLPSNCRPEERAIFQITRGGGRGARADVLKNGNVQWIAGDDVPGLFPLDSLVFPVAGTKLSPILLAQPWYFSLVDSNQQNNNGAGYVREGQLCVLAGIVRQPSSSGSWTPNSVVALMPHDCRPPQRISFIVNHHDKNHRLDLHPDGRLYWVYGQAGEDFISLYGLNFVVGHANPLSPLDSWKTPQKFRWAGYTRQSEICALSGVVATDADFNNNKVLVLPSDCRPVGHHLFAVNHGGEQATVTVAPTGELTVKFGMTPRGSISLDGIRFLVRGTKNVDLKLVTGEPGGYLSKTNLAQVKGAVAFASASVGGNYASSKLNDGLYGDANGWRSRADVSQPFAGIRFPFISAVKSIAFGRANQENAPTDGIPKSYTIQYSPNFLDDTANPADWLTIGFVSSTDLVDLRARRHVFNLNRKVLAGSIRIVCSDADCAFDEIEAYSRFANGMTIVGATGGTFDSSNWARSAGTKVWASSTAGGKYTVAKLSDGTYGDDNAWAAASSSAANKFQFAGFTFPEPVTVRSVAIGRDNTGKVSDRITGQYIVQYSAADADVSTADAEWITVGATNNVAELPQAALRHVWNLERSVRAKAVRVLVSAADMVIDEIEIYPHPL